MKKQLLLLTLSFIACTTFAMEHDKEEDGETRRDAQYYFEQHPGLKKACEDWETENTSQKQFIRYLFLRSDTITDVPPQKFTAKETGFAAADWVDIQTWIMKSNAPLLLSFEWAKGHDVIPVAYFPCNSPSNVLSTFMLTTRINQSQPGQTPKEPTTCVLVEGPAPGETIKEVLEKNGLPGWEPSDCKKEE